MKFCVDKLFSKIARCVIRHPAIDFFFLITNSKSKFDFFGNFFRYHIFVNQNVDGFMFNK